MATSGDRKRVFASSKFSRRTRETYSGSKTIRSRLSAKPRVEHAPLRIGRCGSDLEPPAFWRLDAERNRDSLQLLTPRDEERHLVVPLVLLEPVVESIGTDAEVVDRENLIVHVETSDVCR